MVCTRLITFAGVANTQPNHARMLLCLVKPILENRSGTGAVQKTTPQNIWIQINSFINELIVTARSAVSINRGVFFKAPATKISKHDISCT